MLIEKRCVDSREHARRVAEDVMVPETQHLPAIRLEPARSALVLGIVSVLAAICLDDQGTLKADEIDDEGADWALAAKFEPRKLPAAQRRPKTLLGFGREGAKSTNALVLSQLPTAPPAPSQTGPNQAR